MKAMKNIRILAVFMSFLALTGCDDLIDLKSPSELTYQGFWDTESGARAAHTGLYGTFRGRMSTFWILGELRSDMWGGRTFESPFNIDFIESNITVSTAPFNGWGGLYTDIHRLNDFIANVPGVEFNNPSDKAHMIGQAYGIRAFYYYTLLRTWGDVPITTEPFTDGDPGSLSRARAPAAEVMDLIKSDLQRSLDAFGDDNSFWEGKRIYWSKAATLALKGDVYLWSGNLMGGGTEDFNTALSALNQISGMGVGLAPHYADLFAISNENNEEFIFAFQFEQNQATNFFSQMTGRTTEIHPQFDQHGVSMDGFITDGQNRYGPSEKTLLLLDDHQDDRKDATFIQLYTDDNGGQGYRSYFEPKYFGALLNKFIGSLDGSIRVMDNDVPLYRYADVVLMIAEAKNHLDQDPSPEINQIRQRAYGDDYDAEVHSFTSGSQAGNVEAILAERYKEFVAEGKRWWDLRRAGDEYVYEHVEFISPSESHKLLLPITLDMIGRNPLLEQTPGYD